MITKCISMARQVIYVIFMIKYFFKAIDAKRSELLTQLRIRLKSDCHENQGNQVNHCRSFGASSKNYNISQISKVANV